MENIVRKNILKIKHYVPGKPIEEVKREFDLDDVIKMASNENCFGASPKAVKAIRDNLSGINRYPDASCFYLKQKMARLLNVKEDSLIFGNGSDEIIGIAIRTFINDGDEVIVAKPTFLIYEIASQIQNASVKLIPLRPDFKYNLKVMGEAVSDKTKMIFVANPDNPTGTYVDKTELNAFLKGIPEDVIIFLDEAYFEFANYSYKDYPNGLDYLDRPNVIVSRSFSKVYGLAGLRVGYGISSPAVISYMERVRDPFNVNLLAQAAAVAALDDKAFVNKTLKFVDAEKKKLYSVFRKMGLKYIESATNFVLVDVGRDCKEVFTELLKKGVIVRDMKGWGMDTYIRITIGTLAENKRFVKELEKII